MIFSHNNVNMLYYEEIIPTGFANKIFYTASEAGHAMFQSSAYVDLQLKDRCGDKNFFYMQLTKGNAIATINNETFGLKKNDALILSCNSEVQILSDCAEIVYLIFGGAGVAEYYDYLRGSRSFIKFADDSNIVMHFFKIKESLTSNEKVNEAYISVSISCILAEVYTINNFNAAIGKHVNMVTQAIDFIEQNFMKPITLEDICKNIMYSPFYFSRVFKNETGMSPYEYLIHRRLNYAKHLLIKTKLLISEISTICGYESPISFNKSFKKFIGITPKEFRITNRLDMEG